MDINNVKEYLFGFFFLYELKNKIFDNNKNTTEPFGGKTEAQWMNSEHLNESQTHLHTSFERKTRTKKRLNILHANVGTHIKRLSGRFCLQNKNMCEIRKI